MRSAFFGKRAFFLLTVFCFMGWRIDEPNRPSLRLSEALFREPPLEARPAALWPWLNGYVDLRQMTRELEEMRDKGMRGSIIWDIGSLADPLKMIPAGPAFLGEESLKAIHWAMDECQRLGLELGIVASSSWNAGGAWIEPEDASKQISWSALTIKGPAGYKGALPDPKGMTPYHEEVSVYAFRVPEAPSAIKRSDIRNISDRYDGTVLTWDVPEGEWKVLRFICNNTGQKLVCPSPNSNGYVIDHLSSAAAEKHIAHMIETIRAGRRDFGALKTFMLDSYEVDPNDDWTPDFLPQFKKSFGYDPLPFLPVLSGAIVDDEDVTKRFLHDYRKAVGDLLVTNHFAKTKEILNKNGLSLLAEAGHGGYARVDPLKALGASDVPMGEYWNGSEFWVTKEAASAAHIYGKTLVNAESLTGWRAWKDGPAHYKRLFDVALGEGLNQVTFHTFTHNPPEAGLPGFVYHAGEHFNVNSTWWEYSGPLLKYMARCCYLLQQGRFVGDLCLYYGDQAPNLVPPRRIDPTLTPKYDPTKCGHCGRPIPVDPKGLGSGYDYDYVNEEVILAKMEVENETLTLPKGLTYRVMVLPDKREISPEVLRKLERLIKDGAVVVGPKPLRSNSLTNYPACDEEVRTLGEKIWGACDGEKIASNRYGKGKVVWGLPLKEVLRELGVGPDFIAEGIDETDPTIFYIHRKTPEDDIYFVANSSLDRRTFVGRFRIPADKTPSLWLADEGKITGARVLEAGRDFTRVELDLPPAGSVFVVFRPKEKNPNPKADQENAEPQTDRLSEMIAPDKPWKIVFPEGRGRASQSRSWQGRGRASQSRSWQGRGAPKEIMMDDLSDWTLSSLEGVKYFSGTAQYSTTFQIPDSLFKRKKVIWLDLGEVKEVAAVRINGRAVGTLWKQPFATDISAFVRPGKNQLDIAVTNLWHNRLVGDAGKEGPERFTRTNVQNRYKKDTPLLPSGLIGPVVIR